MPIFKFHCFSKIMNLNFYRWRPGSGFAPTTGVYECKNSISYTSDHRFTPAFRHYVLHLSCVLGFWGNHWNFEVRNFFENILVAKRSKIWVKFSRNVSFESERWIKIHKTIGNNRGNCTSLKYSERPNTKANQVSVWWKLLYEIRNKYFDVVMAN